MNGLSALGTPKNRLLFAIILIFYTVGIVGLMSSQRHSFLVLSPFNLLLSAVCLWLSYKQTSWKRAFDFLLLGAVGFFAEFIGVHTGVLFGDYEYGANLGAKMWDIPLIIAVNWAMLSFVCCSLFVRFSISPIWKAILSASTMTLLDVLIEPVAVSSDFWSWQNGEIPFWNYCCWWIIGFPLHLYLFKRKTVEQNIVSVGLFAVLVVFFALLN